MLKTDYCTDLPHEIENINFKLCMKLKASLYKCRSSLCVGVSGFQYSLYHSVYITTDIYTVYGWSMYEDPVVS